MKSFTRALVSVTFLTTASALSAPTPMGLRDLYQSGLSRSETVLQSQARLEQAQERRTQAKGTFLPVIQGLGNYTRADPPDPGLSQSFFPKTQKGARINAQETLFSGASEYAAFRQTGKTVEARAIGVKADEQRYFLDVATRFYEVIALERNLAHVGQQLKLYDDQVSELKKRVRIGRSRGTEVMTVEAAQAAEVAQRKTLESRLLQARQNLASLTGAPIDAPLHDEEPAKAPLKPLEFYLEASKTRPELRAAELDREAIEESIGIARGAHFPSLDLGANYYLHREGGIAATSKWDATLTLTVPIFAGGVTQSRVREAAAIYREAEVGVSRLQRESRDQVINLHRTLTAAEAELQALRTASDLAEKTFFQIKRDYGLGLTNNLDVVQNAKYFQDARFAFDQAETQHSLNRLQLELAAGLTPGANP